MDYEESSSPQRLQLSDNLYEGEQYDPVSPEVVVLDSDSDGRKYTFTSLLTSVWFLLSLLRDISLTMGGGDRHVRQNSPLIFGDPPIKLAWKSAILPI